MNEGLANGAGDFNVFSALGDVNFQDLSSEIDDDATELNLVKAVASGEKIDTSFAEESEVEATEKCLDAERRSEICQNVASAACDSCAAAGNCPILRMRNFAKENLQPAAKEPKSYLSDLMKEGGCDFVVAGYVSADNEEKASESIEKDSSSENEKAESIPEKPAVKSEVSDDDALMRVSAESNEANEPTDDECLDDKSVSSEDIPSVKIVKENIPPKINEDPDETEAINQINLVDSEDINEKVDIHKEDVSSENQAPAVDKEDELPRELPKKKDIYVGDENNINSAPILEDSAPKEGLAEKVISNEANSSPARDFVQVNNKIDVAMNDNNNAPIETGLSDETVYESVESVESIENKENSPILPRRNFEERKVCFEDSENVATFEIFDDRAAVSKTDNAVDDLGDCIELSEEATRESDDLGDRVELDEEGVCELEELSTSKPEVIGQFIPDDEISQNNIVDEAVKKVAEKAELPEEYSELVTTDDCDESKYSVKIEGSSDYCNDIDNVLKEEDLNIPVSQEIPTLPDNSSEEKVNYNCDEDVANNTNISGVYSGLWADDSPLNPEEDKTSNSYGVNMFLPLVELLGFLAIKTSSIKQEIIIR